MAKVIHTPSRRLKSDTSHERRRKPAVPHSRAFKAVDGIEDALIDAETTMALFTSMVDVGTSIDDACISAIERHLSSDLAAVREAFRQAHSSVFNKGGEQ